MSEDSQIRKKRKNDEVEPSVEKITTMLDILDENPILYRTLSLCADIRNSKIDINQKMLTAFSLKEYSLIYQFIFFDFIGSMLLNAYPDKLKLIDFKDPFDPEYKSFVVDFKDSHYVERKMDELQYRFDNKLDKSLPLFCLVDDYQKVLSDIDMKYGVYELIEDDKIINEIKSYMDLVFKEIENLLNRFKNDLSRYGIFTFNFNFDNQIGDYITIDCSFQ